MKPDLEKYLPLVDHYDLSRAQKIELIHSLWAIMESIVDHAFGDHPADHLGIDFDALDSSERTDVVKLEKRRTKRTKPFASAAKPLNKPPSKQKGPAQP